MPQELQSDLHPDAIESNWRFLLIVLAPVIFLFMVSFCYQLALFAGFSWFWPTFAVALGSVACFFKLSTKNGAATPAISIKELTGYAIIIAIGILVYDLYAVYEGGWDAWAMWNLHARFLADADNWQRMFHPGLSWSSPDYPILMPAINAWLLQAFEKINPFLAFHLTCVTFFLSTISIFYWRFRNNLALVLFAMLIMVSNPSFFKQFAEQQADILIGLELLIVILLTDLFAFKHKYANVLLGFVLGCIINTKNEGLIFVLIYSACYGKSIFKNFRSIGPGLLLPLTCYFIFQGIYAPKGYMNKNTTFRTAANLLKMERYAEVFEFAKKTLLKELMVIITILIIGISRLVQQWKQSLIYLPVILVIIAYHFIFIFYDFSLEWQLITSYHRLIVQLFLPSLYLIIIFLQQKEYAGNAIYRQMK